MTKKRDDLKERLKALKVNEPLRLNGTMKPPAERKEAPQNEAPPLRVTENEAAQSGAAQNEKVEPEARPRIEVTQNEHAQKAVTQSRQAQEVPPQKETPRSQLAPTESPRSELARDEIARGTLPQTEVTQREIAPVQGFFKLSHSVFAEPLLRDLSGDCFRLFLWLSSRAWRYPTSGGVVRASVSYIEAHAGMSHATISRGLKTLKEKGLISVVEVDFKNGNLWQVSALACGHPGNDDKPPRREAPQNEAAQIVDSGASKNESHSLKTRVLPPQNEQDLRSFKKVKKLKEAARSVLPLPERENDGLFGDGEEILRSFEAEFGEEQQSKLVNEFMAREYPHGFFPPIRVVRALAAREWFAGDNVPRSAAC